MPTIPTLRQRLEKMVIPPTRAESNSLPFLEQDRKISSIPNSLLPSSIGRSRQRISVRTRAEQGVASTPTSLPSTASKCTR